MRLNARLPEELARKLEALERATGQSTSDVVRMALERYVAPHRKNRYTTTRVDRMSKCFPE